MDTNTTTQPTAPGNAPGTTATPTIAPTAPTGAAQEVKLGTPTTTPASAAAKEVTGQPGTIVDTTSEYDSVSTYEPKLKKGRHTPLCKILEFGPSINRETQEYQGWSVTLALAEDAPNEFGGTIMAGTRLGMFTIFTQPSQYRSDDQTKVQAKRDIMGLNNIVRDRKLDPKDEKAEAAFKALPASQKLPNRVDHDAAHFEQWKGIYVRAALTAKDKDGEIQVNCNGFLAKDTPVADGQLKMVGQTTASTRKP